MRCEFFNFCFLNLYRDYRNANFVEYKNGEDPWFADVTIRYGIEEGLTNEWKDIINGYIPLAVFSLFVIPINYHLNALGYSADYMLYMWGNGAPILPDMAKFFASHNIQFVYTLIVFFGYILISALVISIEKGVIALIQKLK